MASGSVSLASGLSEGEGGVPLDDDLDLGTRKGRRSSLRGGTSGDDVEDVEMLEQGFGTVLELGALSRSTLDSSSLIVFLSSCMCSTVRSRTYRLALIIRMTYLQLKFSALALLDS